MRKVLKWQSVCAAAAAAVGISSLSPSASAGTIYWQGGNGAITDPNYTLDGPAVIDANDNLAPAATDLVRFGATGTGTLNGASATFGTLWIGHNEAINPSTTNASAVT